MFDPVARLPNPQHWLLHCPEDHFSLAIRALRSLLLLPDEAVVVRSRKESNPRGQIVFLFNNQVESLDALSEGYKAIVALGVDIIRELLDYWDDLESAHGVVLVDELDTHLHPRWKMRIAERLRKALPEVQFLASTHEPLCLRGYFDGEVQVLRRDRAARIERIEDLPSIRGLSVQQILTSDLFGLWSAEDPELEDAVARYVTLIGKPDRTESEERELTAQRAEIDSSMHLGETPAERVVQSALTDYLIRKRSVSRPEQSDISRAAIDRLVKIWDELDSKIDSSTPPEVGDS